MTMLAKMLSKITGGKGWWRVYRARVNRLPENYRAAVDAIEHYLMHFVPIDGDIAATEYGDLVDLFERAAADGTPIRAIVGDNPVEFVEAFAQNYTKGVFVTDRARERLNTAIDRAAGD
jgi:DNA-binding ferritin-like protein (Dps family)